MKAPQGNKAASSAPLAAAVRRRSQALLIRVAATGTVTGTLLTSVAALFLLSLGATPFHLGLLETANHVQKTARLVGLRAMPVVGKTRLLLGTRVASLVPAAGLVLVALWAVPGPVGLGLALVLVGLRGLLQQVGNTAWWPLVQDSTAGDALGGFLARMRFRQRLVEMGFPILVGIYLGGQPSSGRFAPLFALGVGATLLTLPWIRGIGERVGEQPDGGLARRLWQTLRYSAMRRYALYALVRAWLLAASQPFWIVVLTDRGMPAGIFVWMTAVGALGNVCGLHAWGRLVDRHGSRPLLTITLVAEAVLGLAWLGLPGGVLWSTAWAVGLYLAWGALEGGNQMGQSRAMMDAVPAGLQAEGFTLAMYVSALGGVCGGLAGGLVFLGLGAYELSGWEPRLVYLAGVQLALLGLWGLSTLLAGYRDQTSVRALWRRARGAD